MFTAKTWKQPDGSMHGWMDKENAVLNTSTMEY